MALYPNLDGAKAKVTRVLFGDDEPAGEVIITRDPEGADDDTFNTTTGEWTVVGQTTVYEGRAAFRATDPDRRFDSGGQTLLRQEWSLKLPLDDLTADTEPAVGDYVEITACARDGQLVGERFRIDRLLGSSFGVVRKCVMYTYDPLGREIP
jgi:hypothetical protein